MHSSIQLLTSTINIRDIHIIIYNLKIAYCENSIVFCNFRIQVFDVCIVKNAWLMEGYTNIFYIIRHVFLPNQAYVTTWQNA